MDANEIRSKTGKNQSLSTVSGSVRGIGVGTESSSPTRLGPRTGNPGIGRLDSCC